MDAALKRSRSEEPAELLPPARDEEEEEEEEEDGMEQGLEEEEEVGRAESPRIRASRGLLRSRRLRGHPLRSPQ
ncbi:SH3 domain-binding protein 5 [Saguinus oedipus]|uniref:SH3 domain-binding protein 5 n=1 Tax=Saguinus oedipus TaxID=9490 RepID=A0ABQ9U0M7_SAGOE|nr:SH3 domain-binding protein 5 [Saguinus oedipus]